MWINIFLITILIICVITDLRSRKIYNKVIFPSIFIALAIHFTLGGWSALGSAIGGFFIGLGLLLIPYLLGGMGAGDVKLLALIGALKGAIFVLNTAIYMALIGGIIAIGILLLKKGFVQRIKSIFYFIYGLRHGTKIPLGIKNDSLAATYPYGVAIAGGALVALFSKGWINV